MNGPKDPGTPAEWQEALDLAHVLLCIDSAQKYGLIAGGPRVNVDRCCRLLDEGKRYGVTPAKDCVERLTKELL
jgi:hypothetical protein